MSAPDPGSAPATASSSSSGETRAHRLLKQAALLWAQENGYPAAGCEIALPNSRYRADVAACRLERPAPRLRRAGPSAVFECKQARPDFLQDSRPEAASLARLTRLHRRRERLERLIGAHYPHLRRGESLFPEYDRTAVTDIAHEGHRKLIAEIRTLEAAVFGRTKFERLVRYRCANFFYLVIRPGILEPAEIPLDWGLLAPDAAAFDAALRSPAEVPALALLREPRFVDAPESHALDLLHRLAVSGTRRLNRESGLTPSRPGNENGEKNTRTQQG